MVFLDKQKSFDRIWHDGLIYKLITLETPHKIINIMKSFLEKRTFQIRVVNSLSSVKQIKVEVPQGSSLLPQLFAAYVNDMPQHECAKTALFANDTCFYSSSNLPS